MSIKRSCFFISPLKEPNSDIRKEADKVLDRIIKPVVERLGYKVVRSDDIIVSGSIPNQVFERLFESELVIADLSSLNPNVFYELAIRHSVNKPTIHLISIDEKLPFDISPQRVIHYSTKDIDTYEKAKSQLASAVDAATKNPLDFDNPLSNYLTIAGIKKIGNPRDRLLLQMDSSIRHLARMIYYLIDPRINTRNDEKRCEVDSYIRDLSLNEVRDEMFRLERDIRMVENDKAMNEKERKVLTGYLERKLGTAVAQDDYLTQIEWGAMRSGSENEGSD